jgi:hypothetical protein
MLIGFIDDAQELDLFSEVFKDDFRIITALSAADFLTKTKENAVPKVILLDVSFPTGEEVDTETIAQLKRSSLELKPDNGDLKNAYDNMVLAGQRLRNLQENLRNNARGGFILAKEMHKNFPEAVLVGYSRKSSWPEMLAYLTLPGVFGFIQKPNDARSWEDTGRLTRQERRRLTTEFKRFPDLSEQQKRDIKKIKKACSLILRNIEYARTHAMAAGLTSSLDE